MAKLEIDITLEQERLLQEAARREGISLNDLVVRRLIETPAPRNLAEALGDCLGAVGHEVDDPMTSSRNAGAQFTDYLVQKRREGAL